MKKIIITILLFIASISIVSAESSHAAFTINGKKANEIKASGEDNFKITLIVNNPEQFDLYVVWGELDYDKEVLELVNIVGLNNFIITQENYILADRIDITKQKDLGIFELEFKVKKKKDTNITFKNIRIASDTEEINIENASVKYVSNNNIISPRGIGIILFIIVVIAFIFIFNKHKKKKI